jgi:ribonuclease BN (tRNA processing enzyme)
VKRLALYHHAPERDDEGVEKLVQRAKKLHPGAFAAREGLVIAL